MGGCRPVALSARGAIRPSALKFMPRAPNLPPSRLYPRDREGRWAFIVTSTVFSLLLRRPSATLVSPMMNKEHGSIGDKEWVCTPAETMSGAKKPETKPKLFRVPKCL